MSATRFPLLLAALSLLIAGCAYDPQIAVQYSKDGQGDAIVGPQLPFKGRPSVYDQEVARKRIADPTTEPSIKPKTPATEIASTPTTATAPTATKPTPKKKPSSTDTEKPDAATIATNDSELALPKADTNSGAIAVPPKEQTEVKAPETVVTDTAPKIDTQATTPAATETPKVSTPEAPSTATAPTPTEPSAATAARTESATPSTKTTEDQVAVIETRFGSITIELDPLAAPVTVENFKKLVSEGFYNGTTFHRVIPDFMIQGGDPNSKGDDRATYGKGGPGYTLQAEIKLKHKRGSVAMARLPNNVNSLKSSNGSQFYICVIDCPFLDGEYTVFGQVLSGMDVVDRISTQQRDGRDNPLQRIDMKVSLQPRPGRIPPPPAEPTPVAPPAPGVSASPVAPTAPESRADLP